MNIEATNLLSRIFGTTLQKFSTISSFREFAFLGIPHAIIQMRARDLESVLELFNSPASDRMFSDKTAALKAVGGPANMARKMTDNKIDEFSAVLDSTCLIFAHSTLDVLVTDLCRVASLLDEEAWFQMVKKRKFELEEAQAYGLDKLRAIAIEGHLKQLERESLKKRIDVLFSLCKPKPNFSPVINYHYDSARLERLDRERQESIHGTQKLKQNANIESDILYMRQTIMFLIGLLNEKYDVKMDPQQIFVGPT